MDRLIAILIASALLLVPIHATIWKACECCTGVQFPITVGETGSDTDDGCCPLSGATSDSPDQTDDEQPCDNQDCPMTCCSATIAVAISIDQVDRNRVKKTVDSLLCVTTVLPDSRHVAEIKRPPRPITIPC